MQEKGKVIPYIVLLILSVIICRNFLFFGETFIATDFLEKREPWGRGPDSNVKNSIAFDSVEYVYQYAHQYDNQLQNGNFYLWDPYTLCGHPALANFQSAQIYPLKIILHALFDTETAYGLFIFIQLFLAGSAMYIFLRRIRLNIESALFGACVWMLSGQVAVWMRYAHTLISFVFTPLMFMFLVSGVSSRKRIEFLKAGVAFGFQCLGGHQQLTFYAFVGGLIYLIFAGIESKKLFYLLGCYLITIIVSFCIAAAQLIPAMELWFSSTITDLPFPGAFSNPLKTPILLLTILFPRILGGPIDRVDISRGTLGVNALEFQGYIGILALCIALFASRTNRALTRFCIFTAIFSLLFATFYPIYFILKKIPGFYGFSPHRIFLFTFCMTILAALGLENIKSAACKLYKPLVILTILGLIACTAMLFLVKEKDMGSSSIQEAIRWLNISNPHIYTIFISLGLVCTTFVAAVKGSNHTKKIAIISVIAELLIFLLPYNQTYKKDVLNQEPKAISKIKEDKEIFRVVTALDSEYWTLPARNLLMRYNLSSPEGFETVYPGSYARYMKGYDVQRMSVVIREFDPDKLGDLNVKYIITDKTISGLEKIYDDRVKIYKNTKVKPRAFILGDKTPVEISVYEPHKIVLKTNAPFKGRLVLLDTFYPGWSCSVNGNDVTIDKYNSVFRSIEINHGNNTVEFKYDPVSFKIGTIISILSQLVILGILWKSR